jgi:hypothetical protein
MDERLFYQIALGALLIAVPGACVGGYQMGLSKKNPEIPVDYTKTYNESLQGCYKFASDQIIMLRDQVKRTEEVVRTAGENSTMTLDTLERLSGDLKIGMQAVAKDVYVSKMACVKVAKKGAAHE